MLRRQLTGPIVATTTVLTVVCAFSLGVAGPQEKAKAQPPASEIVKPQDEPFPPQTHSEAGKREVQISKMVAEYDLKPQPSPSIPDDPPPHEGAMIDLPLVVEPPDLVIVEVLDALPGRPISGERLVRPDGKIDIGFYGQVYVRGMTLEQVKVALIKHLRKFLSDEALGLETIVEEGENERPALQTPIPNFPGKVGSPLELEDATKASVKPRSSPTGSRSIPQTIKPRRASARSLARPIPVRPIRSPRVFAGEQNQVPPAPDPIKVPVGGQGKVTITVELDGQGVSRVEKLQHPPVPAPPPEPFADEPAKTVVPPAESLHVFVDITAYNSKNYFVLGDVMITGKLPWTGNETVLEAIQYAGGLTASAEPKDIRLVRPGRGGKPAKVYKIDLTAIQQKGDVLSNYQIFPDDRLIVGRNEVVKKTAEIDRLIGPIQSITSYMQQEASLLRTIQFATADNREELMKELVDFWAKELSRPEGVKFDEQTLRDAIMRKMKLTPAPLPTSPAPR